MIGFTKYLITFFIGVIISVLGAIVLYDIVGLKGVLGVTLLIFGNAISRAYKEEEWDDK